MAVLRDPSSGRHVELELHNLIGRSANCHLRLEHPSISLEHASIRFGSDGWYARDLGSTNRTWLDGKALSEQAERLHAGSRLRFGGMEEEWRLVDETPPALIQPLPSGSALRVRHVPFTLPSTGPALASVCLDPNGNVVLERGRARQLLRDGDEFEVGEQRYRTLAPVLLATAPTLWLLREATLKIVPAGHLEHFRVSFCVGGRESTMEPRERLSLLYELAVARVQDRRQGVTSAREGWVYRDTLGEPDNLRHKISRIRKDVRALQRFKDPDAIFEDRRDSHEIRLGVADVEVVTPEP